MLTFWKPGTVGPGSTLDRAAEAGSGITISSSLSSLSLQSQRERLPIFKHSTSAAYESIRSYCVTTLGSHFRGKIIILCREIWCSHRCRPNRLRKNYTSVSDPMSSSTHVLLCPQSFPSTFSKQAGLQEIM